ncbi:hypothetical protein JXR93_01460 [bacterium]|nr:hypothetical protein [bacterium]
MGITNNRKMREKREAKRREKLRSIPQKTTPCQVVKQEFESKQALAEKVIPLIEKRTNEDDATFAKRISTMSNTKLLRLYRIGKELFASFNTEDFSVAKAALVDSVYKKFRNETGKVDHDFKNKLATYSVAKLLDIHKNYKKNK